MDASLPILPRGRGSPIAPPNRFTKLEFEEDLEHLEHDPEAQAARRAVRTEYFRDESKSVVTENDSPDVGFRFSLNPYRGCSHGCSYCYARPGHEFFELNAGLDFETKIFVKERAPELFRAHLAKPGWKCEHIMLSGVTDCYQPAERHFEITRRCLQVALEARQPLSIITKNALIVRDLDLLAPMAERNLVHVSLSVTTLDQSLSRIMEPRTSSPEAKLKAIAGLSEAGVPVNVMVAPIVPGLTDSEVPAILREAKAAGARRAGYVLLRLPLTVEPVFLEWLQRTQPQKAAKIEALIRSTRRGKLYTSQWSIRQRGEGELADQIARTFQVFSRKFGLDGLWPDLDATQFRRPFDEPRQRSLFDE
jgi:DNA repair photolyase